MEIASRLAASRPEARTFYLEGNLGAGKTVFAKGLAAHFGVDPNQVVSPTFALVQRHSEGVLPVYHLDLYRIEHPEELEELGIEEMEEEGAVVIVEWPDRLGRFRRDDGVWISISAGPRTATSGTDGPGAERRIRIDGPGTRA